jgi:predicted AAA+ superfamily ATPase
VKTPKLYFYDSGLLCYLLGIRTAEQLEVHPLRGAVFENWVVAEIVKHFRHRGDTPSLFFFRDRKGQEVDLLVERGRDLVAVEIKSGRTPANDYFSALAAFVSRAAGAQAEASAVTRLVVYGGEQSQERSQGRLLSWSAIDTFPWLGSERSSPQKRNA